MDKSNLLSELAQAVKDQDLEKWVLRACEECPTSDLVVRTPCYGAFFTVVESWERLGEVHTNAQGEIAALRNQKGTKWPRDLNLVLFVAGASSTAEARSCARSILDDRLVCRKHILVLDGRTLADLLGDLPFWPEDSLSGAPPQLVGTGLRGALQAFDQRLVGDLLATHSPGVDAIADNVVAGRYELSPPPAGRRQAEPRRTPVISDIRLDGLEIADFRGIRSLKRDDMSLSGDIVLVYGPNGIGKTSIVDALEWVVTGKIHRVELASSRSGGLGPDPIVNVLSDAQRARVDCHLTGRPYLFRERRGRGTLRFIGNDEVGDDRAMIDHVVGTRVPNREVRLRIEKLRDLFRGSHLLSQHNMREFLEATDPVKRFDILSDMIGADEFVRFRQKATGVRSALESRLRNRQGEVKTLLEEREASRRTIAGKLEELRSVESLLGRGRSAEQAMTDLLSGARRAGCLVEESLPQQVPGGSLRQRLTVMAITTGAAIAARKGAVQTLLSQLETLERASLDFSRLFACFAGWPRVGAGIRWIGACQDEAGEVK